MTRETDIERIALATELPVGRPAHTALSGARIVITPELRQAVGEAHAVAEAVIAEVEAKVSPMLTSLEAIVDRLEQMVGRPIIGHCAACRVMIVEGDQYGADGRGTLLCGKILGSLDTRISCLDKARPAAAQGGGHG